MTNGDKMREVKSANSSDEQILNWAYMNRVYLIDLLGTLDDPDFSCMEYSIKEFLKDNPDHVYGDQRAAWKDFLPAEYQEAAND